MTKITRRDVLAGLSAFAAMPAWSKGAWPERPITLVHGFPPGGPVDVLARNPCRAASANRSASPSRR